MPVLPKKFAIAAAGAAVLAAVAAAQPAAAATSPRMAFYTGSYLTGTEIVVDLDSPGQCENLERSAKSARNLSSAEVEVYFNADCRSGAPGTSGDLRFVVGALHYANFPYPALSYRVRG